VNSKASVSEPRCKMRAPARSDVSAATPPVLSESAYIGCTAARLLAMN
jgi:hypothetical protein